MIPARLLTFQNAPAELTKSGQEMLKIHLGEFDLDFGAANPVLLFILSGGSERFAIEVIYDQPFTILLALEGNNSWAAATEIKAWMNQQRVEGFMADLNNQSDLDKVKQLLRIYESLEKLKGQKLGLIGTPSDWLVASGISKDLLKEKTGIELKRINWEDVPDYKSFEPENYFLEKYPYPNRQAVVAASGINHAFRRLIAENQLDAVSVECFSIVKEKSVTACLSLSDLNDRGIPAGCEGDLTSITGMMVAKAVTGIIPWMANLISIDEGRVRFAHCTAPTQLLESFAVDTHFETGLGTAIAGLFAGDSVTIFRLSNDLRTAFLCNAAITARRQHPENACRTMIEVKLPSETAQTLKQKPLGNHHLILPGDHREAISYALKMRGIEEI